MPKLNIYDERADKYIHVNKLCQNKFINEINKTHSHKTKYSFRFIFCSKILNL